MRIIFMGTPSFAVPTLDALLAAGHDVIAAYSQPPRASGRGKSLRPSPVHLRAAAAGIEVRNPTTLRDAAAQDDFRRLQPDVAVVAAYGLILPRPILEAPVHGCLNVHASILPRWRGAAPIQRAIMAGDAITGISIMAMEQGLDTGPVYAVRTTEVDRKSAGKLTEELAEMGAGLMVEVLEGLPGLHPHPQPEEGKTYAAKIEKQEAHIDFAQNAAEVECRIRAFNPAPGAYFEWAGERIKVLEASVICNSGPSGTVLDDDLTIGCGFGALKPELVQRAGRAAMTPAELLRGFPIPPGSTLA